MLNAVVDDIKQTITNLGTLLEGYAPRDPQRIMIFEIVKSLVGENGGIVVCEAGTGVGKSLGYMMSAIPTALRLKKKVILSTATIALQEQLMNKDLPLFQKAFPKNFSFALAKGRANYVCENALIDEFNEVLSYGGFDLFQNDPDRQIIKEMFEASQDGIWNGERDTFGKTIPNAVWDKVKSDPHRCTSKDHKSCAFHVARAGLADCDVIVANHALVIADLNLGMGGGIVLPSAEETIYVFDEGHHLPKIARESASGHFSIVGTLELLDNISKQMNRYITRSIAEGSKLKIEDHAGGVASAMTFMSSTLKDIATYYQQNNQLFAEENQHIMRTVASHEAEWFGAIKDNAQNARKAISAIIRVIEKKLEDEVFDSKEDVKSAQQIVSDCSFYDNRLENIFKVAELITNRDETLLVAKWISFTEKRGFSIHASPVDSARTLREILWEHANNVVITSATLSALGNFNLYSQEAGLPPETKKLLLGSPFDYKNNATLHMPSDIKINPQNKQMYTKFLQEDLFKLYLDGQQASLVLFSSYWQMNDVKEQVRASAEAKGFKVQCQGESTKDEILKKHREYISNGIPSILMGTGSFSEGLDLPRDLLTNVVITKIPFGTPTDPVSVIYAESLEAKGLRPFNEVSLPDASRQLIQAAGRLIRTVEDQGRVVILDNRMTTKFYGKQLLAALPPFKLSYKTPEVKR